MAENRAAFSLRRRRSLGFSKCRWLRTSLRVPSRSIFFFNRRNARSTDSPFFSLISVNSIHFLSRGQRGSGQTPMASPALRQGRDDRKARRGVSMGKRVPGFFEPIGVGVTRFQDTDTKQSFPPCWAGPGEVGALQVKVSAAF